MIKINGEINIESMPNPISIKGIEKILFQMKKCICKIYKDNEIKGIGFLFKIQFKNNLMPVLCTNNLVLNENDIEINNKIDLFINEDTEHKIIQIDKTRKIFINSKLKLTIIEIMPENDNIKYFLDIDNDESEYNNIKYINKPIYMFNYSKNYNINVSYGISSQIIDNNIIYYCKMNKSSFISPLLSLDTFKIIGITNQYYNEDKYMGNKSFLINDIIDELNKSDIFKSNNLFNKEEKILNEITIRYQINYDNDKDIKIFGNDFVENNKEKCFLIINNKKHDLCEYINKNEIKNDNNTLEIKLKEIKQINNLSYMFYNCESLISLKDISKWDIINVTNMSHLFSYCKSLTTLPDISKWNIVNITNISNLFNNCISLKSLPDISKWNTINITDMSYLFNYCESLLSLPDISKWNTKNVTNISYMFSNCKLLSSLPDISKWNTSNIIDMSNLFNFCESLSILPDISKWNTIKVKNMSNIFRICKSLTSLPNISKWNISNVTDISYMFSNCKNLSSLPDISKWNTSNINNMNDLFSNCISLLYLPDISKWDTKNVIDMSYMFNNCKSISVLPDISKWDISNVKNMLGIFCFCESLSYFPDISKWNTANVNDMSGMFNFCNSLYIIPDISSWNTKNVTDFNFIFDNCISLLSKPNIFN